MKEQQSKFKIGDWVKLTAKARESFPTIPPNEAWQVTRINVGTHGIRIRVKRRGKRVGKFIQDYWGEEWFEKAQVPSYSRQPILSEEQEIAIKELIRKVVQEMDAEGFFDQ